MRSAIKIHKDERQFTLIKIVLPPPLVITDIFHQIMLSSCIPVQLLANTDSFLFTLFTFDLQWLRSRAPPYLLLFSVYNLRNSAHEQCSSEDYNHVAGAFDAQTPFGATCQYMSLCNAILRVYKNSLCCQ